MPNHITTEVSAAPHVVAAITRPLTDKEKKHSNGLTDRRVVDFELVIPIPDEERAKFAELTIYPGGMTGYSLHDYSPMDWQRANWGTKWNAYDESLPSDGCIRFDTAWSHPFQVIARLSERFPAESIDVKYADEDLGSNLGHYRILAGTMVDLRPDLTGCGSDDDNEFAAQVKYGKSYAEMKAEWNE